MARTKKPPKPSLLALSNQPEHPDGAGPTRSLCVQCGLFGALDKRGQSPLTPFSRPPRNPNWNGKLVLVGEAPGAQEDKDGHYFQGAAGRVIRAELSAAGYAGEDACFLNAVRCRPPDNKTPSMEQVRCCRPFLLWELNDLQPQAVLGLGTTAARALTNLGSGVSVTGSRGRLLTVAQALPDSDTATPPPPIEPEGS